MPAMSDPSTTLVDAVDALLPQTQCGRCGYDGCRPYAQALAAGACDLNRCPPGGERTVAALAVLLGRPARALDPACGSAPPPQRAWIDPEVCIGCTKCIQACPVDAIVGAGKRLHGVIAGECNGCALCVAPCPVDCIHLLPLPPDSEAVRARRADINRRRHQTRLRRRMPAAPAPMPVPDGPSSEVQEALRRARELLAARGA